MGSVLVVAVVVPYVVDRFVFKRHVVRFPINTGRRWTTAERWYVVIVVGLAWLIMPFYFINSGTYLNWPAVSEPSEIIRLFIGVNAVGLWDELFFICTVFALLRRHFRLWQANLLQAIVFVSFLWELGYTSWGPFLTTPFVLIQGYLFNRTRSLPYVLCTHLIFDCVLWAGAAARAQPRLAADLHLLTPSPPSLLTSAQAVAPATTCADERGLVAQVSSPLNLYCVFHPDGARRVLTGSRNGYTNDTRFYAQIAVALGWGLLTSEGELWQRHRRLIEGYADRMATPTAYG